MLLACALSYRSPLGMMALHAYNNAVAVQVRFVDPADIEGFDAAVDENTRAIYCETVVSGRPSHAPCTMHHAPCTMHLHSRRWVLYIDAVMPLRDHCRQPLSFKPHLR